MATDNRKPGLVAPEFSTVRLRVEQPCAEYDTGRKRPATRGQVGSKRKSARRVEPRAKRAKTQALEGGHRCGDGASGVEPASPCKSQEDVRARWKSYAPLTSCWQDRAVLELLIQQANCIVDLNLDSSIKFAEEQTSCPYVDASVGGSKSAESQTLRQCSHPQAKHYALAYMEAFSEAEAVDRKGPRRAGSANIMDRKPAISFVQMPEPSVLVGYQGDWVETRPSAVKLWEKASFEPYAAPKPIVYYAICPDSMVGQLKLFLKDLSTVYEAAHLGSHRPAPPSPASLAGEVIAFASQQTGVSTEVPAAQALKEQQLLETQNSVQQGRQVDKAAQDDEGSKILDPSAVKSASTDGMDQGGRKSRQAEPWGSGQGDDTSKQSPSSLDADFRKGLKESCAKLQRLLILDPPDLRYTGGGLADHFNAAIVVYVVCPFDNQGASIQALLEAASALAPCTKKHDPPIQPSSSEARTPGAASTPDIDSGCQIETQGSGAFSRESEVGGREKTQPAVSSMRVSGSSGVRYGGATRAAYHTHEGSATQRKSLTEVKSRGHNLVIQLVSLSSLKEVTGTAARATAFSVYNKVQESQPEMFDISAASPVSLQAEGEHVLPLSGYTTGSIRPFIPLLVLSQQCDSSAPLAAADFKPCKGMESSPNADASPAGVLPSEAPLICDPGGGKTAEAKDHAQSLHCCYALVSSKATKKRSKWMVSCWTDATGELLHTDMVRVAWYHCPGQGLRVLGLDRALLWILQKSATVAKRAQEMSGHRVSLQNLFVTRLGFLLEREGSIWPLVWKQYSAGCSQGWDLQKVVVSVLLSDPLLRLDVAGSACRGTHVIRPAAQGGCWIHDAPQLSRLQHHTSGTESEQERLLVAMCKGNWSDQPAVHAAGTRERHKRNGQHAKCDAFSSGGDSAIQASKLQWSSATVVRFPPKQAGAALLPGELDTVRAWHVSVLCSLTNSLSDSPQDLVSDGRGSGSFINSVGQNEVDPSVGNQDPSHRGSSTMQPLKLQEVRDGVRGSLLEASTVTNAKHLVYPPMPACPAQVQRSNGMEQGRTQPLCHLPDNQSARLGDSPLVQGNVASSEPERGKEAKRETGMESTAGKSTDLSPPEAADAVYTAGWKAGSQQNEEEKDCACAALVAQLDALSVLTSVHFGLALFRPASALGLGLGCWGWAGLHAHLPLHCCIVARLCALLSAAEQFHANQNGLDGC
ncbi:unnamed protein product [Ostreobium quekettii]|uniref:Mediator of RNA polymerase II transcription subunit 13 n=1 Tax=Ostreobium quekettii TaxID=121088 RepID=A0A8S1IRS1_9CHLO|nr:unnamed protein product [Ostreobium quekettii]